MKTNPYIVTFEIYRDEFPPYFFEHLFQYDEYEWLIDLLTEIRANTGISVIVYGENNGYLYNRVHIFIGL